MVIPLQSHVRVGDVFWALFALWTIGVVPKTPPHRELVHAEMVKEAAYHVCMECALAIMSVKIMFVVPDR